MVKEKRKKLFLINISQLVPTSSSLVVFLGLFSVKGKKSLSLVWLPFPAYNPENYFLYSRLYSIVISAGVLSLNNVKVPMMSSTSFLSANSCSSVSRTPETTAMLEDSLGECTGLCTQSYGYGLFHLKDTMQNWQKEKVCGMKSGGSQAQASKSPCPVESHRIRHA